MSNIPETYIAKVAETQPNRSAELNELFGALAKAQSEMEYAEKDSSNPFFKSKFASLSSLAKASRPVLTKNGISVNQEIVFGPNDSQILVTVLGHASGQWMQSTMKINPPKQDVQSLGSYITYLKRYCYAALVGVVVEDESDDDGQAATVSYNTQKPSQQGGIITAEQLEELDYELQDHPEVKENLLSALNINSLDKMPKNKYMMSVKRIREIIDVRATV